MKLDHLATFCALVDGGSLEEASRRVHRTQPAVSQQLKSLESEFGHPLYERRAGRPTPAGERLYQQARTLLAASEALRRDMREFDEGAQELVVGASDTNSLYFLPPFIRRFRKAHPKASLSIVCKPSADVAASVEARELDLGIVTMPIDAGSLAQQRLDEQRLVLLVPRKHPLASHKTTSVDKLNGLRFVLLDAATRTGGAIERFLADQRVEPIVAMRSGSFEVIKRYVAEGVGIAFVPERVLTPAEARNFGVVRVPGLPTLSIGVVWRKTGHRPKGVGWFLETLGIREPSHA